MGKNGGFITQIIGFIVTVVGMFTGPAAPYVMAVGMTMMFGGSIWSADTARKAAHEAMDRMKAKAAGMKANTRTTQRTIPVPYGRVRVGGNIVYMKATGANNNDLHLVYGIGEGPIDGFEEVWFDQIKVWDVRSATSQVDSADNGKIDGPYKDWFSLSFRFGTNSQAPYWQINSAGDPDFQDQYPLLATAYLKLTYNQNVYQHLPQVNFVLRGRQITDNSTPTYPVVWNSNPVNALYDQMTDLRYGWGLPSSKINQASVRSCAVYANGSCAIFGDYIQETIDRHDKPLAWSGDFRYRTTADPQWVSVELGKLGATTQQGVTPAYFTSRLPLFPGSVSVKWGTAGGGAWIGNTLVDTYAGTNPSTGYFTWGSSKWGDINYITGVVSLYAQDQVLSGYGADESSQYAYSTFEKTVTFNWGSDYEYAYRTAYQFLARSVYSYVGSEWFTETGSGTLASNSLGTGTVDYTNGIITLKPRGPAYLSGEQPRVYYKVDSAYGLKRFTYNALMFEPMKAIDLFRETATHFRGFVVYTNGQYYFNSDGPGSSIYSFNDDNIIAGTFRIQQAPISERPNRIRVKYINALANYTPADILYETDSPAVVVADQRELTLELPGVVFPDVAHRMGQTLANQVALGNNVEFQTNNDASAVYPGNIIDITHPSPSWSGKLFRVYETNQTQDGNISIKAVEHDNNMYVDEWQFGSPSAFSPTFLPTRTFWPPAITSLSLREIPQTLSDGTTTPMLEVTAECLASSANVGGYRFWLSESSVTSKAAQLLYSGPSNKFSAHVKPGFYSVAAFTYSEFDSNVLSARGISEYISIFGAPEFEWQKYRFVNLEVNRSVVSSTAGNFSGEAPYIIDAFSVGSLDFVALKESAVVMKTFVVNPETMVPLYAATFTSANYPWTAARFHPNSNCTVIILPRPSTGGYVSRINGDLTLANSTALASWTAYSTGGDGVKFCRTVMTSAYLYTFGLMKNNSCYTFKYTTISKANYNCVHTDITSRASDSIYSDITYTGESHFGFIDCVATNSYMQVYVYHSSSVTSGYDASLVNYTYTVDMGSLTKTTTMFSGIYEYKNNFCNLHGEYDNRIYYWAQLDSERLFTPKASYIGIATNTPFINKTYAMTARDFDNPSGMSFASRLVTASGDTGKLAQYMVKRISSMTDCVKIEADTYFVYKPTSWLAKQTQSWI